MNKQGIINFFSDPFNHESKKFSKLTGVGEEIKAKREEKGWTRKELANKARVNLDTVESYEEYTRNPQMGALNKIAEALDTSAIELTLGREVFEYLCSGGKIMNRQEILDKLNEDSVERFNDENYGFLRGYISTLSCYAYSSEYGDDQTKLEALKQLYQIYKDAGGTKDE